jgi:hypothetical protein
MLRSHLARAVSLPLANGEERAKQGALRGKVLRVLRRAHMYLGLFLLPWLLLFGVSGVLFNHPNIGQQVHGTPLGANDLSALEAWRPGELAGRLVEQLNAEGGGGYRLDREHTSELTGYTVLTAPSANGQYMVLLDMERPRGVLVSRTAAPRDEASRFAPQHIELDGVSTKAVEGRLSGLLAAKSAEATGALRSHPKIAPELRMRVLDRDDVAWNLTYDLGTGTLAGRRADSAGGLGLSALLTRLHTTHHFPMRPGALWFWALFQDLLGVAMAFWAISGLVMWWQMKRTRLLGIVSLSLALGIAALVIGGTASHLTFGDVSPELGPGEK